MPTAVDYANSAHRFAVLAEQIAHLGDPVRPQLPAVQGGVLRQQLGVLVNRLESEPRRWAHELDALSFTCRERQVVIEELEAAWRAWWRHEADHHQRLTQWSIEFQQWTATNGLSGWPGPEPILHLGLKPAAAPAWADLRP